MKIRFLLYSLNVLLGFVVLSSSTLNAQSSWVQIGSDIDGEFAGDRSGYSVSLSADGTVVAIGATVNDGGGSNSGHVRVYENIADVWVQLGGDINGEAADDLFGTAVSISDDGTKVAVGAPNNDGSGANAGHARVYELVGATWTQIGTDINGEAAGDLSGTSISLSGNGDFVAVGATLNNGSGAQSGHVRVYENVGGTWVQVGSDIDGEVALDWSGSSVSLNIDGTIVGIGAFKNDGGGSSSGQIRVFQLIGGVWTQLGADIDGEAVGDEFGRSVSISADGNTFVSGSPKNDNAGVDAGNARAFQMVGGTWTQVGATINGVAAGYECGWAVSISDLGGVIAIGSPKSDDFGAEAGKVRAYENIAGTWVQMGTDILGEAIYDSWGWSVALDDVGNTLAGGAYVNDGTGPSAGHTRVYRFECADLDTTVSATELCFGELLTLYATAASGSVVTWDNGAINGVPFAPASTGITTFTASTASPDDCPFSIDINVLELPVVTAAVDPTEICLGESAIFTGGGTLSYTWDSGVTDGTPFTPVATGTATYTVTGTDINGCENTATVDLIVNTIPVVTAAAVPTVICLGESITFNGGGADTYLWDGGVTDGTPFTPVAIGAATYTVTGAITATGCESVATIDVIVNDTPAVSGIATPNELCLGESTIFEGSGADTYTWDGGITDGVLFTPVTAGTFTYNVTGTITATGCQGINTVTITVFDIPTVTATVAPTEICLNESAIFTGGGAASYVWDGGVLDGIEFTPVADGTVTYTVIGTSIDGCDNTATVDLTVHPLPTVTALADPVAICLGESIVFTGGGADTYAWDGGITDGTAFTPGTAGTPTYTVTGTTTLTGCENTATVDVTVYPNPTLTASATPIEICLGESIILTGGGADSYVWDGGATDGIPFTPTETGLSTFTVTGYLGPLLCESTAFVTITVNEVPEVTATVEPEAICLGESVVFKGAGAASYSWDGDVVNDEPFTPTDPGVFNFTVTGTSVDGCENTATVQLLVYALPDITAELDTVINTGGTANLYAYSSLPGSYYWSPYREVECDTCRLTTTSPVENTTFVVEFVDENGCVSQAEVIVYVNYIEGIGVPTAFSPNYDGNNDILFVKGLNLREVHLEVYNKYGEKVFETSDQNIGWDGTYRNRDENPGVFTWVLEYNLNNGGMGTVKGNTTLVR